MALVDERGRVSGRWNLFDLAVLVLLIGLIPLGYGAFLLFRDQPPRLTAVEPTQLEQSDSFTLKITGENFRPFMRLSLGTQQGREFLFKSTTEAEVPFAAVPAGRYDVILYDQAQERSRLPQALTISPSSLPQTQVMAVGAFGNLDAAGAAKIFAGADIGVGKILAVGKAVPDVTDVFSGSKVIGVPLANAFRLPAVIAFNCFIRNQQGAPFCTVNGVTIAPKNMVVLETARGSTPFQVERVRGPQPLQMMHVTLRVAGHPTLLSKIKAGDVDTGGIVNELEPLARVVSVGPVRAVNASSAEVFVELSASLQRVHDAWLYDSNPLRVGSVFALRTKDYEVTCLVIDIESPKQ